MIYVNVNPLVFFNISRSMKRVRDPYSARLTIMDCKSFFSWFTSCSVVEPETSKEEKSKVVILAIQINIEENGQLFFKTCFGMLMPSSV